ncbi:hypothetical protein A3F00_05425 [Candidatus Daviesbacteria bacterium RIFCSPHIGHO2_12_FULL_37_11]|uniref:Archaeal Type IV pilin N-terminal domain-containing protein n=1 Tax=Candidatus Daviesbacteria bacterium RIFCSPHIGHO2_12_FULL_37_11 TaxID=1797777 RepID=A0A1F5KCF1_9BACT|nr:MAG: hypothetical protein A2769_00630 [Candidatus Daviesbacteria bacterium RIFCSPHIGHO2_01_FULL_37_27]OGE38490.1 MAG: hypothetical protein A3F00_05425 [Candidatus Daviesbacteria bacterium RIFCSPHIGHO2_12_FULL_37_11]OGE45705.1 MAG: hypothetical protein A3B39_05290 [Candidatus Daviesbacteria bacterium RIFCSPLOWO2_01_FULL_37_10]
MNGFIAISTVLILVSVVVAIGTTVTLLSIDEARSGLILFQGEDNLDFVEGCVDDVMLKIRSNPTFSGTSITRPEGTCSISYTATDPNWDITVTSLSVSVQRKIQVKFTRNPAGITLTSWKEI